MSLTTTTVSSAVGLTDTSITVASATGFAIGNQVLIDQEVFQVSKGYVAGSTTVPVLRGQGGTATQAHPSGANATTGTAADFANPGPQAITTYQISGRVRTMVSYSAAGAIALPAAGTDTVAVLNGTTILAMTVAAPTKDMDGSMLYVASDGAAAHTVTFTGGLSGASTSYDVITINATAPVVLAVAMAINGLWNSVVAVPLAGTVTNITATIG